MNKNIRHFLRVSDLSYNEIQKLFERSTVLKKQVKEKMFEQELQNRTLILLLRSTQREQGCPLKLVCSSLEEFYCLANERHTN